MKLTTVATLMTPLVLFATLAAASKHSHTPQCRLEHKKIPACVNKCLEELKWRLKEKVIPKHMGEWCDKTAPPQRADWVEFGRKLDECKTVQCTDVRYWYDMATWHWEHCSWHKDRKGSMAWVNDYRISAWWPNDESRQRPLGHESWISENRTADAPPR